jgi:hypothetical protein
MTSVYIWLALGIVIGQTWATFIDEHGQRIYYGTDTANNAFHGFWFVVLVTVCAVLVKLLPKAIPYLYYLLCRVDAKKRRNRTRFYRFLALASKEDPGFNPAYEAWFYDSDCDAEDAYVNLVNPPPPGQNFTTKQGFEPEDTGITFYFDKNR